MLLLQGGHKPGILGEFYEPGKTPGILREVCATSGKNYDE